MTNDEMKLIYDAVRALSCCSNYSVSFKGQGDIRTPEDIEDAAAEVIRFMADEEFRQVIVKDDEL